MVGEAPIVDLRSTMEVELSTSEHPKCTADFIHILNALALLQARLGKIPKD